MFGKLIVITENACLFDHLIDVIKIPTQSVLYYLTFLTVVINQLLLSVSD
jgi:hypothetical protein